MMAIEEDYRSMKWDLLSVYEPANRQKLTLLAGLLVVAIALADWMTTPYLSLGFLYLFPIMIASGYLSRLQIVSLALICTALQEVFSNLPHKEEVIRLAFSAAGFIGTGLFISELLRNRRSGLKHVQELENQVNLRRDAEEQLRILVESSPAAIVTIDLAGKILIANEAAQQLLTAGAEPLLNQSISRFIPALQTVVQTQPPRVFRTTLQCKGRRRDGEFFLAGVWFSTYTTMSGPRLAAIMVDLSEDLRNREDLSLDHLYKNTQILMSAVAHEVQNLCSAALVVYKNLSRVKELQYNEDFQALSTLIQGLQKVAALELRSPLSHNSAPVDLMPVLDELRVLIDTAYQESGMEVQWQIPETLPLVCADRYGLIQVFLNLAKNSQRAMESAETKRLSVSASEEGTVVVIRFEDTGLGVAFPDNLFRPFQSTADSTGLGLYVSRAIMLSFGGDLLYESRRRGSCFAVRLTSLPEVAGVIGA